MSAARAHQPPRTQLSAAGSEAQDTGNFSGKPSVQIRSKFSCLEDRKGQYKKEKKTDNTNTWDVVMSVWECLRSRREQKWVGGHRCRGSALSRLSSRSPRRARAGHIVPKQRRAAAHRARRAARCGRRDPGPSPPTGFVPALVKRAIRVGGHRCRGSALSRLSPRSPRRARAGHIVLKQRRAAAYLHSRVRCDYACFCAWCASLCALECVEGYLHQ